MDSNTIARPIPDPLSQLESTRLSQLQNIVDAGLQTFVKVGKSLKEIRDGRLYRTSHSRFDDYCRARWGWSKSHSNRLIEGARAADNVTPIGVKPANEAQVRPLTKLPADEQREAWGAAVETSGGSPTARDVQEAVGAIVRGSPKAPGSSLTERIKRFDLALKKLSTTAETDIRRMDKAERKRARQALYGLTKTAGALLELITRFKSS